MADSTSSKSDWVKRYISEHGCSKQAAYKAWDRVNQESTSESTQSAESTTVQVDSQSKKSTSSPESTSQPVQSQPDLLATLVRLQREVTDLARRVTELEYDRRPVEATSRSLVSSAGKSKFSLANTGKVAPRRQS